MCANKVWLSQLEKQQYQEMMMMMMMLLQQSETIGKKERTKNREAEAYFALLSLELSK